MPAKRRKIKNQIKKLKVVKVGRFVGRHARRSGRRTRRTQRVLRRHNLDLIASLVGLVATILLTVFVGVGSVVTIVTGIVTVVAGGVTFVRHNATPSDQVHVRRDSVWSGKRDALGHKLPGKAAAGGGASGTYRHGPIDRVRSKLSGGFSGDRTRMLLGRRPCGARCQWSSAPVSRCECSCGGVMHGSKRAGGPVLVEPPKPVRRARGGTNGRRPVRATTKTPQPRPRRAPDRPGKPTKPADDGA